VLIVEEIGEYAWPFTMAAESATLHAWFDSTEIHRANRHLVDQFMQSNANGQMDTYGSSVQNHMQFVLESLSQTCEVCVPIV
jgi:2,4-dienoyl-CoA reductase-like NADH-dependent reductase (Old Yellow Enzyme family)